jgi:hypothetical protein
MFLINLKWRREINTKIQKTQLLLFLQKLYLKLSVCQNAFLGIEASNWPQI